MKYIAICARGLEDVTQKEIKEILKITSKMVAPGRVEFTTSSVKRFISKTRSVIKVYLLKQECKTIYEIKPFKVVSPFKVEASIQRNDNFVSIELEREVGEIFFNHGNKVDLKNPKTVIFVDVVGEKIFLGVDETPALLSKREYRIKVHNQSINSCIAYALVRLSGYDGKKILLDPYAKDGVIAIEALLFKKGKVYAIEGQFSDVKNIEINSSLAHVRKEINVSRLDVEWLDTKFKKGEIDCLVSAVPYPSKNNPEKLVEKKYKELFYQLEFIMKRSGRVILIAPTLELLKKVNEKFKIVEERKVSTSNFVYDLLILRR